MRVQFPYLLLGLCLAAPTIGSAAQISGEAIYQKRCASCHEQISARIPHREALRKMSAYRILRSLDFGTMMSVAYPLRRDEREAVAGYLGIPGGDTAPLPGAYCADRRVRLGGSTHPEWNGWSPGITNIRFQPASAAGLTIEKVRRLKLKWAYGFDGDVTAFAQPTVLGRYLFVGSAGGLVQALSSESGCIHWVFQAGGPVRSAILAAQSGRRRALLFGDQTGWFYALEAETGRLLWKKKIEAHEAARLTGAPVAQSGTVFVPIASWEETRALNPEYPCCNFRGSVVALRIRDGSLVWKTYTIRDTPGETGKGQTGVSQWGPSGAGVWSSPTLDPARGLLYVSTGNNYSAPATDTSDAVLALDLKTGQIVWSRRTTPGDIYSGVCSQKGCEGPDYDFGASVMREKLPDGRELLFAGQKSGMVYALDPERQGEIVWQTRVAKGGTNGGVQWGMASDGEKIYAAASDVARMHRLDAKPSDSDQTTLDPRQGGGLTALSPENGTQIWSAPPSVCGPQPGCSPAQSAALTVIPGAVFSGSMDGHLRAFSTGDGQVLWDFDTVREYQTVNGIKARGGSLDGPGAVVIGGMVFVNSGYARLGGMPGNVLLAFASEE